jgi:ADP-ribose pyrophosphatase YjhB (NUDIX family)
VNDTHDDYTHPDVLTLGPAQGWAEAETDPTRIDWSQRQARAVIPFVVIDGRPVNPCEKTGIRHGRNEMGHWGENLCADALVTVNYCGAPYLLMVEREDGYGWAVPGGHVDPGETGLDAAIRELHEETALGVPSSLCTVLPARYVPDPRASDEAWAVTVPVHVRLPDRDGTVMGGHDLPLVEGADDARRAEWVPASSPGLLSLALRDLFGGTLFAAHRAMLADFLTTNRAVIGERHH